MMTLDTTSFCAEMARISVRPDLYSSANTHKSLTNSAPEKSRRRQHVGIGRSIRVDIVAAALREAGIDTPTILPRTLTAK